MIVLASLLALALMLALTLVTGCIVAVLGVTSPARAVIGPPPQGLGATSVTIAPETGPRLAGWFAPGRPGRGAILLVHGIRADRRVLASRMTSLVRAGFAVLALDLRAHGESAGQRISFGLAEAEDVVAAAAWLRRQAEGERLGVLGISLGGAAAAMAASRAAIDALVLESVFPDLRSAVSNRVRGVVGGLDRVVTPALLLVGSLMTGVRVAALRPSDALGAYEGPVLVISGTADRHTTIAEARALHAAIGSVHKELWEIEGAGHVDLEPVAGAAYVPRITGFFGRHLARLPACA